jgi:hypothetical protein
MGLKKIFWTLVFGAAASPLLAVPGHLENGDYKVSLSETLPGLDDQTALGAPPTITATVVDKFRSTQTAFPLNFYALPQFFLSGGNLNLLGRTNLKSSSEGFRYSFLQISLSNPPDSRGFGPLKQYSFSPDDRFLLAVFDGQGHPDSIGVIRFDQAPAQIGWLYANGGALNLFKEAAPNLGSILTLNDPVGWSADSSTAVFILSNSAPTAVQNYLVRVDLASDRASPALLPVDLSAAHYQSGGVLTRIVTDGQTAELYFNRGDSSDVTPVTFTLPHHP